MRKLGLGGLALSLVLVGSMPLAATAQDMDEAAMMEAWMAAMTPGPEHEELAGLAGSWRATTQFWMTPDGEPTVSEGSAERAMIMDGRVLEETFQGQMAGQPFTGRALTGYDNVTGQYWGTWFDTMSTGVTLLYGDLDAETGLWVMEGQTPDPMTGGMVAMRIESRRDGPDRHVDTFYFPGPDGTMMRTMEMVYERQ